MAFMDQQGNVKPVRLTPDGSVPVAESSDGPDLVSLFRELIAEVRALRLLVCESTGQEFVEELDS